MTSRPFRAAAFCALLLAAAKLRGDDPPVSFAKDVAPVLVNQCLVCHNARAAKGRLSVETFQALMKGGGSGPAVVPGDAASDLVQLVEVGDMPKDGDPLPAGQVALLKRWIAQGAKLDEGKSADEPLTAIMPKPPQPVPPEVYPAPVPVTALAFRPDGSFLAVSGYHEVLLFGPSDGRLVRRFQNLAERVHGLAFSPDGQLLAVAAGTPARLGEVKLYRVGSDEVAADLAYAGDSFFDVAFSPDGSKLAAAGADRTVRVWNIGDGTELARIEDHADWVTAVTFSPDGSRVATASRDKTAKVFDLATKESLVTFTGHEQPVLDVFFAPDGAQVVTCGKDRRVRGWSVADAKQKWSADIEGEALCLAPAGPDAFLCGSGDRAAHLFGFDGKRRKSYDDLSDWVYSAAATSDAATVALGTWDGTVTLRNRESGGVIRSFPAMPPKP
jgi:dipeptidyl aminopeptidase/acylaminoacyl peptidase